MATMRYHWDELTMLGRRHTAFDVQPFCDLLDVATSCPEPPPRSLDVTNIFDFS